MSSTLFQSVLRLVNIPRLPHSFTPSASYASKKKGRQAVDPRLAPMKRALYPRRKYANYRRMWMVLKRAIPSFEVNETINRAWALHQRHLRESRTASLAALHSSMRTAVDELEQVDSKLYEWATEKDTRRLAKEESEMIKKLKGPARNAAEARVHGLFPREMRIPRDTPSQSGWDYSWKAPSGGVSTSRS